MIRTDAMIPDLYGPAHDAMRFALADVLAAIARHDDARHDDARYGAIAARWSDVARLVDSHARAEAATLLPLLAIAAPRVAAELGAAHAALAEAADAIGASLATLVESAEHDRRRHYRAALVLVRHFIGDCLSHLGKEEETARPALVGHFPPATLFAARHALLARLGQTEACANLAVIATAVDRGGACPLLRTAALQDGDGFAREAERILSDAIEAPARIDAGAERLAA